MSIVIYRAVKNDSIRKFSKFACDIKNDVDGTIEIKIAENSSEVRNQLMIKSGDLIIFIAHGGPNCIYHLLGSYGKDDIMIVDADNIELLKGKKVIAFSCYTLRELSKMAIKNGCVSYLGFSDRIYLECEESSVNKYTEFKYIMKEIYKEVFKESVVRAIIGKWNFDQLERYIRYRLGNYLVNEIMSQGKVRLRPFKRDVKIHLQFAIDQTKESLGVVGDRLQSIR